jgi:hypothetical protein
MTTTKFNHCEAFALMWYACKCGHRERIWNSRDGVTPYGIGCPSCGEIAHHVDWKSDEAAPDHKPHRWQRIFRDGTPADAVQIMTRRIKAMRLSHLISEEREAELLKIAASEDGGGEFLPGWPMIDIAGGPFE